MTYIASLHCIFFNCLFEASFFYCPHYIPLFCVPTVYYKSSCRHLELCTHNQRKRGTKQTPHLSFPSTVVIDQWLCVPLPLAVCVAPLTTACRVLVEWEHAQCRDSGSHKSQQYWGHRKGGNIAVLAMGPIEKGSCWDTHGSLVRKIKLKKKITQKMYKLKKEADLMDHLVYFLFSLF